MFSDVTTAVIYAKKFGTLPKTKMAPENKPSLQECSLPIANF